jgi:hypothetical protein
MGDVKGGEALLDLDDPSRLSGRFGRSTGCRVHQTGDTAVRHFQFQAHGARFVAAHDRAA